MLSQDHPQLVDNTVKLITRLAVAAPVKRLVMSLKKERQHENHVSRGEEKEEETQATQVRSVIPTSLLTILPSLLLQLLLLLSKGTDFSRSYQRMMS